MYDLNKEAKLTDDDQSYLEEMKAWIKEQEAREKGLRATIENSSEIVRQNEIQLEFHLKRVGSCIAEHNEWRKERGLPLI